LNVKRAIPAALSRSIRIRASVNCVILPASNNAEHRYIAVERPPSLLFMSRYFHRPDRTR